MHRNDHGRGTRGAAARRRTPRPPDRAPVASALGPRRLALRSPRARPPVVDADHGLGPRYAPPGGVGAREGDRAAGALPDRGDRPAADRAVAADLPAQGRGGTRRARAPADAPFSRTRPHPDPPSPPPPPPPSLVHPPPPPPP